MQAPAAAAIPLADPQHPARPSTQPVVPAKITLTDWLEPLMVLGRTLTTNPFHLLRVVVIIAIPAFAYHYLAGTSAPKPQPPPQPSPPSITEPKDYVGMEWPPLELILPLAPSGPPLPLPNPLRETPETIGGSIYKELRVCLSAPENPNEAFACIPKRGGFRRVGADVFLRVRSEAGFAIRAWGKTGYTTERLCEQMRSGIRASVCYPGELQFNRSGGKVRTIPHFTIQIHGPPVRSPPIPTPEPRKSGLP